MWGGGGEGGEEESEKFPLSYKLRQEGGWRRVRNLQSAKSCPLPHPQTKRKLNLPMLYASATPQRERERERERSASSCVNTQCVVTKFAVSFMVKTLKKEEIIRHISTAANRNAKLMFSFRIGQLWKTCSAKKNSRLWKTDNLFSQVKNATLK